MPLPKSPALSTLPDLRSDARLTVHVAYERAIDVLIRGFMAALPELAETEERVGRGEAPSFELIAAFQAAQHRQTKAKIEASLVLFDAIANEYSGIDTDRQVCLDRL